jgi:hypothetical protein
MGIHLQNISVKWQQQQQKQELAIMTMENGKLRSLV